MSKSKIPAHRVPVAKAKAVAVASPATDLSARRQRRQEVNATLIRRNGKVISSVPASDEEAQAAQIDATEAKIAADRSVVATVEKAKDAIATELAAAVAINVPVKFLHAALAVAPKKDNRGALNGVHIHRTDDGQSRIVATDGNRLFVASFEVEGDQPDWLNGNGVTIPTAGLARVLRYFGNDVTFLSVKFGVLHQYIELSHLLDPSVFKLEPVGLGNYPQYQRVMDDSASVFAGERSGVSTTMLDQDYLKSAGVVANELGAKGILPHVGDDPKASVVFTFAEVDNALLYIMPRHTTQECLPAAAVRMHSKGVMKRSVDDLRAQAKRCLENAKKAKHDKFRELFKAKAARLTAQADSIQAAQSVKIAAPKAAPVAETAQPQAEAQPVPVPVQAASEEVVVH